MFTVALTMLKDKNKFCARQSFRLQTIIAIIIMIGDDRLLFTKMPCCD